MKIEVNIEKRYFFILLSAILLVGTGFFVYAYNPNFNGPPPIGSLKPSSDVQILGHSADELKVWLPKSTDSSASPYTLQEAINLEVLGSTVSKRYICDGSKATEKFVSCTIPESNRWAGCFVVGFEAVEGGGAFDDGCFVTKTATNGPWQFIINQDGGEKIKCSARCITGNGAESFGATELTVNSLSSPPSPEPGIPQ